ncbi:hypothetical protein DD238_008486 [Peronospora effusa]|uniref:Uncharacterized protein n=1 Tax=Peronospora effusa TaxID=542832 RepID=A0A3M6VNW7_9STRA|nr:hypothetical protein DD238_008486 [Peronospora effusa]
MRVTRVQFPDGKLLLLLLLVAFSTLLFALDFALRFSYGDHNESEHGMDPVAGKTSCSALNRRKASV